MKEVSQKARRAYSARRTSVNLQAQIAAVAKMPPGGRKRLAARKLAARERDVKAENRKGLLQRAVRIFAGKPVPTKQNLSSREPFRCDTLKAKACPNGYVEDKVFPTAPRKQGTWPNQVHVVERGCKDKKCSSKGCNWHGEFATCSTDPNSKSQREGAYNAAVAFQKRRVERVESILGYSRRRVGNDMAYHYMVLSASKPVGQVLLSADAALRAAIAKVRSKMCLGKVPKKPKTACTAAEFVRGATNQRSLISGKQGILALWQRHMMKDHGIRILTPRGQRDKITSYNGKANTLHVEKTPAGLKATFNLKVS